MAIKIGSISISLTAETSSFQTNMEKASQIALNSSRNIERSFTMMGTAIAAATGSAIGALGLLIDKTQETVFSMQKMAQQAGTSLETFSKLAYAAKVAGMPTDQLAVLMDRLAHSQMLAAGGSLEQSAAFKALGVNVADANGHFKDTGALMLEVAKHLDEFKMSANKTAIETIIMGRSGAQAAELMNVLANRFDEVSETASRLGVVFTEETAQGAQKLHDSMVEIEEAGLGLSVRLLSQVSPALDDLAKKIVTVLSNQKDMKAIDDFGHELAEGVHLAGEAFEFLVTHLTAVKRVLETLALIRVAGFLGPMISSASEASGVMGKLGLAALNMTGSLLGVRKLGTIFLPAVEGAKDYVSALNKIRVADGMAEASTVALEAATYRLAATLKTVRPVMLPILIALEAYRDITLEISNAEAMHEETGQGYWTNLKANIEYATASLKGFKNTLEAMFGVQSAISAEHTGIDKILNVPKKTQQPQFDQDTTNLVNYLKNNTGKTDMPGIQLSKQHDELAKRLQELTVKAQAAQDALRLVGASPQLQRDAEIVEKYNEFLEQQKDQLDKLSPAQRRNAEALAHEAISTQVNFDAVAKYSTELLTLNESLSASAQDHLTMAAAVGKSAQAMQDALVQARLNAEMSKTFGANWQKNPDALAASKSVGAAIREDINQNNALDSKKAVEGLQDQIDAQERLNAATLKGNEAKRQAQIVNEQESLRRDYANRGDTNVAAMQEQIDMVRQKSDAEKEAADLERASSMNVAQHYAEQVKALHDAVDAANKYGVAIDYRAVLAADKEAWLQFEEAQDKAILSTGNMLDGLRVALDQLARDTESDAQIMHDAFMHAVESINSALSSSLMAHANSGQQFRRHILNSLGSASRGIGSNLLDTAMKKGESALLKGTGFGKPDGSSQNPFYVRMAGTGMKSSFNAGGNELDGLLRSGGDTSSASQTSSTSAGNMTSTWMSAILRGIFPAFADGGDVVPGMPSIIGERGPELWVPPSAGHIVPNSALRNLGGGDVNFHIDASHSNDPAQTAAMVRQALNEVGPHIAAGAVKMMHERMVRRPSTSR